MIGTTISHYKILEKLGQGGMGEVWKAQDTRLDRFVALKFLPEKTADDSATVERFLREARAASALNHPGICTIHDIGEHEGRRFIVMEFVEGQTLGALSAQSPLDPETIVETGIQLADALDAAHAKNIIHRDIKSTNIILSPRGQAKILDFGLAKIVQPKGRAQQPEAKESDRTIQGDKDLTDAGEAVGTVSYMSPEQALGKDIDGRTDIFSLGVVLYEMATGRQAFPGSTTAAIFDAILNKAPTSPVSLNNAVSPELERIINKALEKDRDLRYQNAADLMADLKRMRRDSGSQSVSTAAATAAAGAGKPRTGRNVGIGIGAVALVAIAALLYLSLRDRGTPAPQGTVTSKVLTSLVGVEQDGTWSPDGAFFAFAHSASGPADIYVMSVNGGDPVELGVSDADDLDPRWSPDNRWIAFSSNRAGPWGIYLVPPLGGATQRLVDLGVHALTLGPSVGAQPWSPDGRFYLYTDRDTANVLSIWKIDVDGRQRTKLTSPPRQSYDTSASWSFDGKQIAFVRWFDRGPSIMVMTAEGEDVQEVITPETSWLPDGSRGVTHPAWAPDSRSLVVEASQGGTGIWLTRPGSSKAALLVSGAVGGGGVSISKTGRVLYNTYEHQTDLYLRDMASGEERRLTAHTQDNFDARFSPDGKRVAYMSSRTGDPEIWVLELENGNETRLTHNPHGNWSPDWSPDGREVVFMSGRPVGDGEPGTPHLWRVSADGGAPQLLSDTRGGGGLRWSPGGGVIGFTSWREGTPELWAVNADGSSPRKLMAGVRDFGWYRDDGHVIVTTYDPAGPGEMRAVDLATGEYVTLVSEPQRELEVAPDASKVNFLSAVSHYNMNLFVLRLSAGEDGSGLPRPAGAPEQVTYGDGEWHVHNGSWSPDGKFVAYTRDTDKADIYEVEGVWE